MQSLPLVSFETHTNFETWIAKTHSRSTAILIKIFLSAAAKILPKKKADHKQEEAILVGPGRNIQVRHFVVRIVPMSQHAKLCFHVTENLSARNLKIHWTDKIVAKFFPVHFHCIIKKFRINAREREWKCTAKTNLQFDFISRNNEIGNSRYLVHIRKHYVFRSTEAFDQNVSTGNDMTKLKQFLRKRMLCNCVLQTDKQNNRGRDR